MATNEQNKDSNELFVKDKIIQLVLVNRKKHFNFDINTDLKEFDAGGKEQFKKSILEGFIDPFRATIIHGTPIIEDGVLVDVKAGKLQILDGKHRNIVLDELEEEGVELPQYFPVLLVKCDNEQEAAEFVLKYTSAYAKTDVSKISLFMERNELEYDKMRESMKLIGVSEVRLDTKMDYHDLSNIEADDAEVIIPEMEQQILVKRGDLFQFGEAKHRVLCGDCLNEDDTNLLMTVDGEAIKVRLSFNDPPYNLPTNFFSGKGEVQHEDFAVAAGEMSDEEFVQFLVGVMQKCKAHSVDGSIHYICMDFRHAWHVCEAGKRVFEDYSPKNLCVWNKSNFANGSFYRAKHELVFVYKHGTAPHISHIDLASRVRTNVWDYHTASSFGNKDRGMLKEHPTPKPVPMVADAIIDVSNEGDAVIDWFTGSGTSLIAAEQTKRRFFGTEIEPKYLQTIIKRWVRYCKKHDKKIGFKHLNGDLKLEQLCPNDI
ncbi:MAG: DNA-methyltransferase [Chitinophagales bacterium]